MDTTTRNYCRVQTLRRKAEEKRKRLIAHRTALQKQAAAMMNVAQATNWNAAARLHPVKPSYDLLGSVFGELIG